DDMTRSLLGLQYYADSLNQGSHKQGIAHRQDRRAIDHNAIVRAYRFSQQFAKTRATENFRRIWSPPPAGKDIELSLHRGNARSCVVIHFNRRDDGREDRASQVRFTDEIIDNAG